MRHLNDRFELHGQSIVLRFYRASDLSAWRTLFSIMKLKQNQWDWEAEKVDEMTEVRFQKKLDKHRLERKEGRIYYFCVENKEKLLIGIGLITKIQNDSAEIGFQINNRFWGMGYGTELAHSLVEIASKTLRFKKLIAKVNTANESSIHILERVGMVPVTENNNQWIYELPV